MSGLRRCRGFSWLSLLAVVGSAAAADAVPAAGTAIRDCDRCPELVVVPSGQYVMGARPGDNGADDDEGPPHAVTIAKPFALGKFEVTFDDWEACVADNACERTPDETWGRGRRPVLHVDFERAVGYTKWLSTKTGKSYRLPTEAEWEYAARAGSAEPWFWGADPQKICGFANVYDESAHAKYRFGWKPFRCDDQVVETAPVGSFPANAFGLHDMLGNVWEWVADCYRPYDGSARDQSAVVMSDCKKRLSRGGSWNVFPVWVRASYRYGLEPQLRSNNLGLRVVRELP